MKSQRLQDASPASRLAAALLLTVLCAYVPDARPATDYIDLRRPGEVAGDAVAGRAKAATCIACHAEGVSPAPVFPHLRGQTVEYLYWSLVDFTRGTRPASPMTPLVAPLGDQDLRDLAAFYAGTPAAVATAVAPPAPAATQLAAGERLYRLGDPARGIPPCQGCHGVDAGGHPLAAVPGAEARFRTYPALRGQWAAFIVTKLNEYRAGSLADSTNDFVMTGAARGLDDDSIQALAAWLASL